MLLFIATLIITSSLASDSSQDDQPTWRRGNTHTHTLWSDGDAPPEHVIRWYVENDYDFLVLSDHNVMQQGERWFAVTPDGRLTPAKMEALHSAFGADWADTRKNGDATEMRLRTLKELKDQFEKPNEFILIPGEEVTDRFRLAEIHINAMNIEETIQPQHGESAQETIQNNIDAIIQHGRERGRPVLAHLNHPNFRKSLGVENLANMKGERFFEVYNGHRGVENEGDANRPSTEVLWDRALTKRLHEGAGDGELLYGLATDDSHNHFTSDDVSVPGRGWVMVRCESLEPGAIIEAMKRGDFYASSGVAIKEIKSDGTSIEIEIEEEPGVQYVTEFIGTRIGTNALGIPGQILSMTNRNPATYTYEGDELYVRARITSTKPHPRPYAPGDYEMAWTQPTRP